MQTLTTPFGRRPLSLGHLATQIRTDLSIEDAAKPGSNHPAAVNKWTVFRTLTQIRDRLGVSDRSLALLNALLTFHPETALTLRPADGEGGEAPESCGLVVFPSNKALALRAHGMAEKTLRRHLAALVEAGLIIRRDSPNGKRYARKDASGEERFSEAFGFDLTPLVARCQEFEALADSVRHAARARALLKERISLHRRDVSKLIALGLDEELPGDWEALRQRFMGLVTPLRRVHSDEGLQEIFEALGRLRETAARLVEAAVETQFMTGNAGASDRHQSNSNTQPHTDLEHANKSGRGEAAVQPDSSLETDGQDQRTGVGHLPLGMVMEACPDVRDYSDVGKIRAWPDFVRAARVIRPMLGISPDAWAAAVQAMGEESAAVSVAIILQRSQYSSEATTMTDGEGRAVTSVNASPAIGSPGGYLRSLTHKALAGEFAAGPVLMSLIGQRQKMKRAGMAKP
jgi:replication initiation protein RepC